MLWPSQTVQFMWFIKDPGKVAVDAIFRELLGGEPDAEQTNRTPSAEKPFLREATLTSEDVVRTVQLQPGRVLLLHQAANASDAGIPTIETNAAFDEVLDRISRATSLPEPYRLSVVAHTLFATNGEEEARGMFFEAARIADAIDGCQDLNFQINVQRDLGGVRANRVVRYSLASFQRVSIQFGGGDRQVSPEPVTIHGISALFDFNTVPQSANFSPEQQNVVFPALVAEIRRAAEVGDITFLRD